jgi:hypothetical protein
MPIIGNRSSIARGVGFGSGVKFLATGGDEIVTVGGNVYHVFTTSGTFSITDKKSVDIVVVGGGASGGGGGGGAGAIEGPTTGSFFQTQNLTRGNYSVTIGAGGPSSVKYITVGTNGGSSIFAGSTTITALGGGRGQGYAMSLGDGGSGGGKRPTGGAGGAANGANTNVGGGGGFSNGNPSGGGGGATTAGSANGSSYTGGAGGQGALLTDIDANLTSANFTSFSGMTRISSGGGGLGSSSGGQGGTGAGNAAGGVNASGGNAVSFGSGGGGAAMYNSTKGFTGAGKSGLVIVRYSEV